MRSTNIGNRVFLRIPRPAPELVAAFATLESSYVTDAMGRFGGMTGDIRPVDLGMRLCGPAITVRAPPGDVLMVFKALDIAQPGDVLVIESHGYPAVSQWGDLTSMIGQGRGLAGVVTDGALRDIGGILKVGFPVFARHCFVPLGSLSDGPGEVNAPVAVGGVPVMPGDIVVGDHNGVVVVPRIEAENVLVRARAVAEHEREMIVEFQAGRYIPGWLDARLAEKGCEIVDDAYPGKGDDA